MKAGDVLKLQQIVGYAHDHFPIPSLAFDKKSGTMLLRLHSKLQLQILPSLDDNDDGRVTLVELHGALSAIQAVRVAVGQRVQIPTIPADDPLSSQKDEV